VVSDVDEAVMISGGARVSGAVGIDHFGTLPSSSLPSPLLPLEVGPLKPSYGFSGAL